MTVAIEATWRLFISLRLTFVLLIFIGFGAVLGMSFDQTVSFENFYLSRPADEITTTLLSFFELNDAFHSWWFSGAILLLSLNLIACSIERLPRIYFDFKHPRPYLTDRRLMGLSLKHHIEIQDEAKALKLLKAFMPTTWSKKSLPYGDEYFYVERHGLARFGVYVVHIALLIIMFSSIYATQTGIDGNVMIEEGQQVRFITCRGAGGISYTYDLGFYVGCDDFRLRTFVDNSPMEFESDLYISRDQKEKIEKKTVRVNEPLQYAGFTFYQASYKPLASQQTVELEIGSREGFLKQYRVQLMMPLMLPNGEVLTVEKIYDDFAGLGQAIRVSKKDNAGQVTYFHVFRRYKEYDRLIREDEYFISFLGLDQQYATGLSIGKVPGISCIFFGFLVLLLGLYMCFFMTPIRYFARLSYQSGHLLLLVAAQGYRNPSSVKDDFHRRLLNLSRINA
jgi:cytochrome c biogenesis protein